jgi:toxin secretion/phage lysis holin
MAFKLALSICGTIITFLVGGWAVSLTVLCVFMAIDIITGVMKGAIIGGLRSSIGYKGMLKKSAIMLVIILAHMLDLMIGGLPVFRTMATYFYIGNEGLSILENLGQMGVPVPKGIAKYIKQLSKKDTVDEDTVSNSSEDK